MTICTHPRDVRLLEPSTPFASFLELHDHDNGLSVLESITLPTEDPRQARRTSARVHGSYATGPVLDSDGSYVINLLVEGDSWVQCTTRFEAVRTALRTAGRSRPSFLIEEVASGVRRRWWSDAPVAITAGPTSAKDRRNLRQEYDLRFVVQPNPSVTFV